jgi:hypothetical protein
MRFLKFGTKIKETNRRQKKRETISPIWASFISNSSHYPLLIIFENF